MHHWNKATDDSTKVVLMNSMKTQNIDKKAGELGKLAIGVNPGNVTARLRRFSELLVELRESGVPVKTPDRKEIIGAYGLHTMGESIGYAGSGIGTFTEEKIADLPPSFLATYLMDGADANRKKLGNASMVTMAAELFGKLSAIADKAQKDLVSSFKDYTHVNDAQAFLDKHVVPAMQKVYSDVLAAISGKSESGQDEGNKGGGIGSANGGKGHHPLTF